ncbi:MAG: glycosyltransferase family A protein [Armatimonadota bacterium]
MNQPTVSVVIPVFNRFELLKETVDSILSQTYRDFELLLVDDFSTDGTRERLAELLDDRIVFSPNPKNMGAGATRNRGIDLAKGQFIALTDQDDLWHPTKLEEQVEAMQADKDVVLVGTHAQAFSIVDGGRTDGDTFAHPADDQSIREFFFYSSPFVSSTVLVRGDVLRSHSLRFRTDMGKSSCEDYDLWRRISGYGKVANIPKVLLDYREHATQQSRLGVDDMCHYANVVRKDVLESAGIQLTERQFGALERMGRFDAFRPDELRIGASTTRILLKSRKYGAGVHREMFVGTLCRTKTRATRKLRAFCASRAHISISLGMLALYIKRLSDFTPIEL